MTDTLSAHIDRFHTLIAQSITVSRQLSETSNPVGVESLSDDLERIYDQVGEVTNWIEVHPDFHGYIDRDGPMPHVCEVF